MSCGRCGNNQVGGTQDFICKDKVRQLKHDIHELEKCLIAATPGPGPGPRPCRCCHCCCCCCHHQGGRVGNQTTWGRCN